MKAIRRWLPLLLLVPLVALLWLPFFNVREPSLGGFPFFYIWLAIWIVLTSVLTWVVHRWWQR